MSIITRKTREAIETLLLNISAITCKKNNNTEVK